MREVNGENPQNARIKISYSKKKPTVKFSYPVKKKDSRTRGDMLFPVIIGWIIILFFVWIGISIGSNSIGAYQRDNQTSQEKFVRCALLYPNETLTNYTHVEEDLCKPEKEQDPFLMKTLIFVGLLVFGWMPIYFPFKKRWDKLYPDFQAWQADKKCHKFNAKEIKESNGKYYVELPIFNNVICDWKATKDFSKYMDEFEIEEYKFRYLGEKDKKKKQKNENLWYARWYFKNKPEKGFIEVIYK